MKLFQYVLSIILSAFISASAFSQTTVDSLMDSETYQIGLMVQTVQVALTTRNEKSLQTISSYGTDQRYDSMIKGWLFQELVAVERALHHSKNSQKIEQLQGHSNFLKKAINAIGRDY